MPGKLCVENCVENLHGKWGKRENRRIKISFTGTSKTKFWHEKRANVVVIYLMLQVFTANAQTHAHSHNKTNTHTKGPANCLKSHRQSQWPTQQNERRKNEFFGQARIDTKFVCNFQQTGEGGEWERSEQGADCWTFVALVAILSARHILILKVCHGIPFVCCVYVMRECVCGDINKSIYVYSLVISIYISIY